MEKAKEFLENTAADEAEGVSQLTFPPHKLMMESSFYDRFMVRGMKVDRVERDSLSFSFRVPPRLTNCDGELSAGAIASLIDETASKAVHEADVLVSLSVDASTSYISSAKMHDELEIISKCLGKYGNYSVASVIIRNKQTGEVIAEGRHSYLRKRSSKL